MGRGRDKGLANFLILQTERNNKKLGTQKCSQYHRDGARKRGLSKYNSSAKVTAYRSLYIQ